MAEQRKPNEINKVLEMMESLNVMPTEETYNNIIRAWAKVGDLKRAEDMFSELKKRKWVVKKTLCRPSTATTL